MKTALGKLGWTPDTFWSATWIEFECAIKGLAEFHGAGTDGGDGRITKAEADALVEKARANRARKRARYGDGR